jgi:oligopeptide/dipeptide ABC transporter ATP-binding protein
MYLGKIVELAPTESLFTAPRHPYTRALLAAAPIADPTVPPRRLVLEGDIPSPLNPPSGCRFHTRCPYAQDRCRGETPALREVSQGHRAACHFAEAIAASDIAVPSMPAPAYARRLADYRRAVAARAADDPERAGSAA